MNNRDIQNENLRKSKMNNLLNGTNESFYWLGFLLADGHFDIKNNKICLSISVKDIKHIEKYKNFINYEPVLKIQPSADSGYAKLGYKTSDSVAISCGNVNIFPQLQSLLDLKHSNKTYNPPDISLYKFADDNLFSLIVGIFDGDGNIHIKKGAHSGEGQLQMHSSWKNNLDYISCFLEKYLITKFTRKVIFTKKGFPNLRLSAKSLSLIKRKCEELKLPIIERKWNLVKLHNKDYNESKYKISTSSSDNFIRLHLKANDLYLYYLTNIKIKPAKFIKYITDNFSEIKFSSKTAFKNLLKKFKSGWIPFNDRDWLEFHKIFFNRTL